VWVVFQTLNPLSTSVFVPDRVIPVVGVKQFFGCFIDMPEGVVDGGVGVFLLALVGKRAPPILHNFDEIHRIAQKCDRHRTVHFAVEYPEPLVVRNRKYTRRDDGLGLVIVTMRDPRGYEIPIPLHVPRAEAPQVPAHERHSDEHERRRRKYGDVYERNPDDDAKKNGPFYKILA